MRKLSIALFAAVLLGLAPGAQAAPANDNFEDATVIASVPFEDVVWAGDATRQPGEPASSDDCAVGDRTVWYRFTPAHATRLVGDTSLSDRQVIFGVYTGTDLSNLTSVQCNENRSGSPHTQFSFDAAGGTAYFFQLGISSEDGTVHFRLQPEAAIEGTVRGDPARPLSDVCVGVYDIRPDFVNGDAPTGYVGGATTGRGGRYRVGNLIGGEYRIQFQDCNPRRTFASEWYSDKQSFGTADNVSVPVAGSARVDAVLARGGTISGVVTDSVTHAPLSDTCVHAYDDGEQLAGGAITDSRGQYSIDLLPAGTFKMRFTSCGGAIHFSQWFRNKTDFSAADPVTVVAGRTTRGVDAALGPATGTGSISGTVTNTSGEGLGVVCVHAYESPEVSVAATISAYDGTYRIDGLGTGVFKVFFEACGTWPYAATQWYDGQADFASATPVAVVDGSDTAGIDATLDIPWSGTGRITGTVTDAAGSPVYGICVTAYVSENQTAYGDFTGFDGTYHLEGLGTASFKIRFEDCSGGGYRSEWFDNRSDFASGDWVAVTDGAETGGIDATLEPA